MTFGFHMFGGIKLILKLNMISHNRCFHESKIQTRPSILISGYDVENMSKLFRETCEFMNMLIFKITSLCQIISALNSWITFNNHHQPGIFRYRNYHSDNDFKFKLIN